MPRQPGCGHNGTAYVSDPIYIWNQTGRSAYDVGFSTSPGCDIVKLNRDLFVNSWRETRLCEISLSASAAERMTAPVALWLGGRRSVTDLRHLTQLLMHGDASGIGLRICSCGRCDV